MRKTLKPIVTVMATASLSCFALAACSTEPDEMAEVPIDESTVVDADAAGVGVPQPQGDAEPSTAIPESGGVGNGEVAPGENANVPVPEDGAPQPM